MFTEVIDLKNTHKSTSNSVTSNVMKYKFSIAFL